MLGSTSFGRRGANLTIPSESTVRPGDLARRAQRVRTSADGEFTMSSVYLQSLIPEDPTGGDVPLSARIYNKSLPDKQIMRALS